MVDPGALPLPNTSPHLSHSFEKDEKRTMVDPGALALPRDWMNWRAVAGSVQRTMREQWQMSRPSSATAVATSALSSPALKRLRMSTWTWGARGAISA